jgi:hypothetical protein
VTVARARILSSEYQYLARRAPSDGRETATTEMRHYTPAMKVTQSLRSTLSLILGCLYFSGVGSFHFRSSLARKNHKALQTTFSYFNTIIARSPSPSPHQHHKLLLWGTNHKSDSDGLHMHSQDTGDASTHTQSMSIVQKLGLSQQFERWKFLQDLLEGDVEASDANQVLYQVLTAYSSTSTAVLRENSYPVLDNDNRSTIRALVDEAKNAIGTGTEHEIAILVQGNSGIDMVRCEAAEDSAAMISDLETLLPDPVDDEDAFKSNWDTVMEIHGREGVRINQEISSRDWEARCMVARVLLWLEFLGAGVLKDMEYECESEPFA